MNKNKIDIIIIYKSNKIKFNNNFIYKKNTN